MFSLFLNWLLIGLYKIDILDKGFCFFRKLGLIIGLLMFVFLMLIVLMCLGRYGLIRNSLMV